MLSCAKPPSILDIRTIIQPGPSANVTWSINSSSIASGSAFITELSYVATGKFDKQTHLIPNTISSVLLENLRPLTEYVLVIRTINDCGNDEQTANFLTNNGLDPRITQRMPGEILLIIFMLLCWIYFLWYSFNVWSRKTFVCPKSGGYNIGYTWAPKGIKSPGAIPAAEELVNRMHAHKLGSVGRQTTNTTVSSHKTDNDSSGTYLPPVIHVPGTTRLDFAGIAFQAAKNRWKSDTLLNRVAPKSSCPGNLLRVPESEGESAAIRRQSKTVSSTHLSDINEVWPRRPRSQSAVRKMGSVSSIPKCLELRPAFPSPTLKLRRNSSLSSSQLRKISEVLLGDAKTDIRRCSEMLDESTKLLSVDNDNEEPMESRRNSCINSIMQPVTVLVAPVRRISGVQRKPLERTKKHVMMGDQMSTESRESYHTTE